MSQRAPYESDRSLDDPLAGLVRPSGDPVAVRSRCIDFRGAAGQLEDIGRLMEAYRAGVAGHWHGDGARAFTVRTATLPRSYAYSARLYRSAAGALDSYAGVLADAQRTFDQAHALVAADDRRQRAILAHDPQAVADLLAVDRVRARRLLEEALARLAVSTVRTLVILQGLEAPQGKRPPVLPDIYRGANSSFHQGLDELHDKSKDMLSAWWAELQILNPKKTFSVAEQMLLAGVADQERFNDNPIAYVGAEAYDMLDLEEMQSGNDARWAAGVAFELVTHWPKKFARLARGPRPGDPEERPDWHAPQVPPPPTSGAKSAGGGGGGGSGSSW
ncbi:MAG: hypothetical protein DLM59_16360 [Pseudonocardiales bacterium]|nr:MAG: hypothetical protein DLM59_16360 [Pseudonocardiales bacterium]